MVYHFLVRKRRAGLCRRWSRPMCWRIWRVISVGSVVRDMVIDVRKGLAVLVRWIWGWYDCR